MRLIYIFILLGLTCCLASCATMTEKQVAQNKNISWDSRAQTLSSIEKWDLKGLIAIREARDSVSANLHWQQFGKGYHIALYGPLGSNSYELTGRPGRVELAGANGQRTIASSPEDLIAKQAGWHLPVSNLYYWIRGIPVPNVPSQKQMDAYNHLTVLNQQGWNIQYLRYTSINNIDIPSKIFLNNPQLNVKIVINQWQL